MKYTINLPDYWEIKEINNKNKEPFPLIASVGACNDDCGYIFGGEDSDENFYSNLYRFNFNTEKIELIDRLPIRPRAGSEMFVTQDNTIYIVGGFYRNYKIEKKELIFFNEIIEYRVDSKEIKKNTLPENFKISNFSCCLDYKKLDIYIYGGDGIKKRDDGFYGETYSDFYKINIKTNKINKIIPKGDKFDKRSGMTTELLPNNNIFIFSGFYHDGKNPVCFSDYYLYDIKSNVLKRKKCNEFVGRTFAKPILFEDRNFVLLYGGTYNGMELSASFVSYDYIKDVFNLFLPFEPLPEKRVEPVVLYSKKKRKIYIIGGGKIISPTKYSVFEQLAIFDLGKYEKYCKEFKWLYIKIYFI